MLELLDTYKLNKDWQLHLSGQSSCTDNKDGRTHLTLHCFHSAIDRYIILKHINFINKSEGLLG